MALKKDVTLGGGIVIAGAYVMLNHIRLDKITGVVTGTMEVYRDEATRRDRQAKHADHAKASVAAQAAASALQALLPAANDSQDDIARKEQESIPARAALLGMQGAAAGTAEMLKLQTLQPVVTQDFTISPDVTPSCVTPEGTVDMPAVYARIKLQLLQNAQDC